MYCGMYSVFLSCTQSRAPNTLNLSTACDIVMMASFGINLIIWHPSDEQSHSDLNRELTIQLMNIDFCLCEL